MLSMQTEGSFLFFNKRKRFPIFLSFHINNAFPKQKFTTPFSRQQAITKVAVLKPNPPLSLCRSTAHFCEMRKVTRFGMEAPASKYLEDTDQTLFTLRGGERAASGIIEEKHELLRPEEAQVFAVK